MQNGKTKKTKHILTGALASIIVLAATSSVLMSGCGESSESTNETKTVTETQLVTVVVDETNATDENGNTVSAENTNSKTSSNGNDSSENDENSSSQKTDNSESSANSSSGGNSSNNSASSNSSNKSSSTDKNDSNSSNSSSSNSSSESSNTHKPVTDSNACTLDGNKYAVGDTVTCVYKLNSPETLENYQGYITYDTKYLSVKSAKLDGPAKSGGILNYNLNGKIKFNGSNISTGYDYTDTDSFVVVNYEIKATGSTTPKFIMEVATGESGKAYAENDKLVNGLKITKEYS